MNAIAWTVAQSRRLDLPCGAEALGYSVAASVPPKHEPIEREQCAQWVASLGHPVTWVLVAQHFGCTRMAAMKRLQACAEHGLLRRIPSTRKQRPDLFEGV